MDELVGFTSQMSTYVLRVGPSTPFSCPQHLTLHVVFLHDGTGQQEDISSYFSSIVRSERKVQRWREEDHQRTLKKRMECKGIAVYL